MDPYVIEKSWPTDGGDPERHAGFGDVTLRVKRNLVGNDSTRGPLAVGLIGYALLPTGRTTGAGALEYGLLLPATYALSDSWNLSAQLPLRLRYDRDEGQHYLETGPSLNLDHAFAPWLTGFVEAVAVHDFRTATWDEALNLGPGVLHRQKRAARPGPPLRPHPRLRPGILPGPGGKAVVISD